MATKVYIKYDRLRKRFGEVADKIAKAVAEETKLEIQKQLKKKNNSSGDMPSSPGEPPAMVSGKLLNSIKVVKYQGTDYTKKYKVETKSKYARIQEFGGILTAKRGKFLTIPLNFEARQLREQYKSLRQCKFLVFIKPKNKEPLLCKKIGQRLVPMFALKKQVYLPPRPFIRPAKRIIGKRRKEIANRVLGKKR